MGSFYRDGADFSVCLECGESFDVNNPERRTVLDEGVGVFQPFCLRHLKQRKGDSLCCVSCADEYPVTEMRPVPHMHPGQQEDTVLVCSAECLLSQMEYYGNWMDTSGYSRTSDQSAVARDVADAFVDWLNTQNRVSATLCPQFTQMDGFDFIVNLSRQYGDETEDWVKQFHLTSVTVDGTEYLIELIDWTWFGICRFNYTEQ